MVTIRIIGLENVGRRIYKPNITKPFITLKLVWSFLRIIPQRNLLKLVFIKQNQLL